LRSAAVAVEHGNRHPVTREPPRDRAADAAAASGYQPDSPI